MTNNHRTHTGSPLWPQKSQHQ